MEKLWRICILMFGCKGLNNDFFKNINHYQIVFWSSFISGALKWELANRLSR